VEYLAKVRIRSNNYGSLNSFAMNQLNVNFKTLDNVECNLRFKKIGLKKLTVIIYIYIYIYIKYNINHINWSSHADVRFVTRAITERSAENYHDNKKKMTLQHIPQFSIMELETRASTRATRGWAREGKSRRGNEAESR